MAVATMTAMTTAAKTAVKTRDAERTRIAILRAAQSAFSLRGFSAVSVRDVTGVAEVNPSLVSRYFGSKEALFEEALADLLDTRMLTGISRTAYGKTVMKAFTTETTDRINPLPMLVLATADPASREIADRLLRALVITPLIAWFDLPNAEERAARLVIVAAGFFTYRLLYPLDPLAGPVAPATRAWLERAFQSIIDDPV